MSWHSTHRTQWEEITDNCTVTSAISFPILFCFPFQMTPTNQNCTLNVTRSLISLLQFFFQGHYDHVQGWLAPKSNPEASIAFALKQQEDRPPWLPALVAPVLFSVREPLHSQRRPGADVSTSRRPSVCLTVLCSVSAGAPSTPEPLLTYTKGMQPSHLTSHE